MQTSAHVADGDDVICCKICTPILRGRGRRRVACYGLSGFILVAVGIIVPLYVLQMINVGICDLACVPTADMPAWRISNWASNTNSTVHPPEYMAFHLYNITNPAAVLSGSAPVVTQVCTSVCCSAIYFL
jgi:hypothetical protein